MRKILPSLILLIAVWGCNRLSSSSPDNGVGLRGKEYSLIKEVNGYESFETFSTTMLDDTNQFALSHYKSSTGDLFVLEGMKRASDGSLKTIAIDFLQFEASTLGENFVVGGSCKVGTENDPQLIGLFSMNPPGEGDASVAIQVWRADHESGKIKPIDLKGVLFYNEIND